MIAGRKNASVVEFLYLFSVCFGACRLRVQRQCPMSRAMIASAYIRQPSVPACHSAACMDNRAGRTGLIFNTVDWLGRIYKSP